MKAPAHASASVPARPERRAPRTSEVHAELFRALGDATRIEIVRILARARSAVCACHIEQHFDLAQPTVSHHLRILREAGVVTSERRGTWVHYSLDARAARRIDQFRELLGS